jgi:hypothetical protein
LASLNLANVIGAWDARLAIVGGLGLLSAAWAGLALTFVELVIFLMFAPRRS